MKKTLARTILPLFLGAILICAFASSAGAYRLESVDDMGITYTLDINGDGNPVDGYTATFSIDMGDSSDSSVGWVAFHFSGKDWQIGTEPDYPNPIVPAGWGIGVDETELAWGGQGNQQGISPFNAQWAGFYSPDVALPEEGDGGLALTGEPPDSYEFTFTILGVNLSEPEMADGEWPFEEIPFKVGYYDLETGNPRGNPHGNPDGRIRTAQTSGSFSVPEPGTLLLVGSGLLLLGLWGRRKFKTVR